MSAFVPGILCEISLAELVCRHTGQHEHEALALNVTSLNLSLPPAG